MRTPTFDLFLIRHGVTDWNESGRLMGRTDVGLNPRGRAQAEAVAAALREVSLARVLSSPLPRARETAECIARPHGLTVQTEIGLDEVWLGRWQGKTWDEVCHDPDVQRVLDDPTYVCDALEPAVQVQQRVVTVVERLRAASSDQAVALVSHGDPLRVLLSHHLSMPLSAYRRLVLDTGSVTVLRFAANAFGQLILLNWKPPGTLRQLVA